MEHLTYTEEETMQAVWRTSEGNIKAFMEHLDETLPYTTVASTIKTWKKRVPDQQTGGQFLFIQTRYQRRRIQGKFMGKVVKEYFENSYKELVSFFVEQKNFLPKN